MQSMGQNESNDMVGWGHTVQIGKNILVIFSMTTKGVQRLLAASAGQTSKALNRIFFGHSIISVMKKKNVVKID